MTEAHQNWEGRSRGTKLGYRIFIWLLKKGGLRAAYRLLPFVTGYYRLFVKAATDPLRSFYKERMGFSSRQASALIKKNLHIFGQTLIDKFALLSGNGGELTIEHEGVEHLEQLVRNGEGGLLVSAHLGNWEAAGHLLKRLNVPINIVMYDGESQQMKQYLDQFNSKRSFNIITISDDLNHIYEMMAALRRNEMVCMHADRFRPGNRTFEQELLGRSAHFPAGPFLLASKLKAPVSFVMAFKETDTHYHFLATPGKKYEGRGDSGARIMLDDYVALLEEKIPAYPEQWFNYYDFWAAKP